MRASLSLRGDPAEFRRLIGFAEEFAERRALPKAERARLFIILEELFTNTLKHGRLGNASLGAIEIALDFDAGQLTIEFSDAGPRFDPLTGALTDLDRPSADRGIGGLGLHIVRSLVDDAHYSRAGDRNNLVLTRKIASFDQLVSEVRACTVCAPHLPHGPRPVLRGRPSARLLIISQAPGARVHETGLSFDDRSGDRLREWLGLDRESFYDENRVAIMPVGFCYPGRDARGGDLPPRRECAPLWHPRLRAAFRATELTLLVGSYAAGYYLPGAGRRPMADTMQRWRDFLPEFFVLPHPSWHTTRWLRDNPWFESDVLPELRRRVGQAVSPNAVNPAPRSAPYPRH